MDALPVGLRVLVAVATCHSWSRLCHCRRRAGTSDQNAVQRLIRSGYVVQLPSGALHLTTRGRWIVRTVGTETVSCSKCRQKFERDAFAQANRRQCRACNPTVWSDGVRHAA